MELNDKTLAIAQYRQRVREILQAEEREIVLPSAGLVKLKQKTLGFNDFATVQRKGLLSNVEPSRFMGIGGAGVVT